MEDIRIQKTKHMLRMKLIELLSEMPFDKIKVADLCRRAYTSRVTYYTYYDDKYSLVDDMMDAYYEEAVGYYNRLLTETDAQGEALAGYQCLLLAILELYDENPDFFVHVSATTNPYLYSAFYKLVYTSVTKYIETHNESISSVFSARETAALLCSGLWSVINECYAESKPKEEIRQYIMGMYRCLLESALFKPTQTKQ